MYNNVVEAALEALWKLGYATLRFNFRGVGESEGEHSGGVGESDDAKAAMRFILSQPGIAKDGAIMAGYSFGAAVAMRAGAELQEVATIAAIALPVGMSDFSSLATTGKKSCSSRVIAITIAPRVRSANLAKSSGAKLQLIEGCRSLLLGLRKYPGEGVRRSSIGA